MKLNGALQATGCLTINIDQALQALVQGVPVRWDGSWAAATKVVTGMAATSTGR